ncbi:MAG: IS110 family transposase [Rhodoferax sp.]|uniref:IS110 family transposase n=1 Tax=Rhodoferax sp. TaxID=50421 RepID=UPI002734C8FA|nr:IS110 family transposase [Rhodoferax sp.]MDP2680751.1 IS110 family transposase [Rhodoferax sp.]
MSQPLNKSAPSTPASKTKPARKRAKVSILSIAYPNACGIDIGATSHFVAVPSDRDDEPVREFPAFTADLERLVQWLRRCRVTAVAMESTGVYWIPLFEMLDAAGFEVHLVNARHVKNVPGRKSDVLDCQWLQQLMSYGLLRGGFRPAEEVCALRAVWRHRDMLLSYQARHVQHLQKAMTQMNVQLHHVISDIMGVTGQAIVRAIVAGERDAATLAKLRDRRIKADEAEVAAALQGNWRDEHLFALKQALALIDAYAAQITECDGKLQQLLGALKGHALPEAGLGTPKRGTPAKNSVRFDARTSLFEASGVDLTRIPGIDTSTALKVISEIGVDLARFPTVKHFTSWLGLCPGTKISGGKVLSSATKPCANRAAQALRMAAQALRKSQTALGAHHRRLCSRMDKPKAITASAHKLARLVYFMLTKGQAFVEAGQDEYEERYRQRVVQNLTRRAHQLGFLLTPQETSSA